MTTDHGPRIDVSALDGFALAALDGLEYSGDADVCAGGLFWDASEWRNDYVEAVRVTDADSAMGWRGAILVERIVILIEAADVDATTAGALSDDGRAALDCCGMVDDFLAEPAEAVRVAMLIECAAQYGRYDPADPSYFGDDRPRSEWLQTAADDPDSEPRDYWAPMQFDGTTADRRVLEPNVNGYLRARYLRHLA